MGSQRIRHDHVIMHSTAVIALEGREKVVND